MKIHRSLLVALSLVALCIYLFVSAPPALTETAEQPAGSIPIERVLETVAAENDIVRKLYTQEIVGKGKLAGLQFDEQWQKPEVQAGPLPALFLREAARSLQKKSVPLGLFLGSDFPISSANRFDRTQNEIFQRLRGDRKPQHFYAADTKLHTAMFPDVAGVEGCVTCHNEHPESPKTDWKLDDVMGATTWTYPKATVTPTEYLQIVAAVRESFADAYAAYLQEVKTFAAAPEVGGRWPAEGFYLPSGEVFMAEFAKLASSGTVDRLLIGSAPAARTASE
ncbi:MAG: DUF3365 domain-containing protein [Gemmatimonadetes bacterium]|nr:DUF3365 domain-containing protein [Gemmatimonadota bacterium]